MRPYGFAVIALVFLATTLPAQERTGSAAHFTTTTCVVAIRTDKGVIMGCDSCGGDPHTYRTDIVQNPLKVAKVGEFLIGYTTSFRMGEILHKCLRPMEHDPRKDIFDEIVTILVPQLQKEFKSQGFVVTHNGSDWGGEFLLAHGKRLFHVYDDFCVLEFTDKFTACGCGEHLASGAMYSLTVANERNPKNKIEPKAMLEIALQAAEKYSGFVRGPFHYVQNF